MKRRTFLKAIGLLAGGAALPPLPLRDGRAMPPIPARVVPPAAARVMPGWRSPEGERVVAVIEVMDLTDVPHGPADPLYVFGRGHLERSLIEHVKPEGMRFVTWAYVPPLPARMAADPLQQRASIGWRYCGPEKHLMNIAVVA